MECKVYARQVASECVDTNIYLEDYCYADSEYLIDGGKHYYGYNDGLINKAKQAVDNYYEMEYGYHKNLTEYFEYYLHKHLAPRDVGYLKHQLERNDLSASNYEVNFVLAFLKVIKRRQYGLHYLRGYCQGEIVKLYAPLDTPSDVIDYIESLYWNLGSELIIHDEDTDVKNANDVSGYSIYVNEYDKDKLKEAIARETDTNKDDVVLFVFDGWSRVANYERV